MSGSPKKRWAQVFGLGIFIVVASGIGIAKSSGAMGEFFGTLIAGVLIIAIAFPAAKASA